MRYLKWIILFNLLIGGIFSSANNSVFFDLIHKKISILRNENIDTIIVFGYNNLDIKSQHGASFLYLKGGIAYRNNIVFKVKKNKTDALILKDTTYANKSFNIIFDFIKDNFLNAIQEVDTIRNIEIKRSVVNGVPLATRTSATYYMGVLFYLGINIGDKVYSDNLPMYNDYAWVNKLYRSHYYYWTLYSMLNNL